MLNELLKLADSELFMQKEAESSNMLAIQSKTQAKS